MLYLLTMSPLLEKRIIVLADDDNDDADIFQEILDELTFSTRLAIAQNGEQLMQLLYGKMDQLPHVLFLDLNMPKKNGFECLVEIKKDKNLKIIPVVIITTSNEPSLISLLYNTGADYYIRKPNNIEQLKYLVELALTLTSQTPHSPTPREKFVLLPQPVRDGN